MIHAAATLILLREQSGTLEVLMLRRHSAVAFLGGVWVFPGGRLDAADQSPAARARVLPGDPGAQLAPMRSMAGEPIDSDLAAGLHVAACREAFEEAGVLLACRASGESCDAVTAARLAPLRPQVTGDASAFPRMLEAEGLFLDLRRLVYWSHWITPSLEPKRFDTRFFVAQLPPGQAASADFGELTEHAWIDPTTVPARVQRGDIMVIPPTLLTLEDLAESHAMHGSLPAMLAAEAGRETPPVMPRMELSPDEVRVVMPWDPAYDTIAGERCEVTREYPAHLARRASSVPIRRPGRTGK